MAKTMSQPPPPDDQNRAYTVAEFARRLSLTPRTIERRIKAKDIRAVKLGGATRIPHTELERILKPL